MSEPSAAMVIPWEPLVEAATLARERAYAPYSRFLVGAALITESGDIFAGCNVENRTFGLSVCAERSAIVAMVAAGKSKPQALAVIAEPSPPARPCGLCLETLTEFASDLPILLTNPAGEREMVTLRQLFPQPFIWAGPHGAET